MLISFIQTPQLQNKFKSVRSSRPEVFLKKVFLKISQNSQANICAGASFLKKLQDWGLQLY